jgi:hypothetical protein
MKDYNNLINKKFEKLTITAIIPFKRGKYTDYKAKVKCDWCANIKDVYLRGILDGKTKSCGCQRYSKSRYLRGINNPRCKNLTGKKFGMLSVLKIDNTKNTRIFWVCKCDCGNTKSVCSKHLTSNLVKSCGCIQHLKGKNNKSWKGYEEISGKYWNSLINGAISRNLEFSINIEYAWQLFLEQNRKCALSGLDLVFEKESKNMIDRTASLDRIDSKVGYIEGNVQWVDKKINVMKMDLDIDFFLNMCKIINEHNNKNL